MNIRSWRWLLLLVPAAAATGPARILMHAARRARQAPARRRYPAAVDSITVLGTAQYDGRPSPQLRGRLDHAVDLHAIFPHAVIHPLGGKLPDDRYTEAQASEKYLRENGVDGPINAVPVGSSTRQSFRELVDRADLKTCLVVTDPNHCLRAEKLARAAGIDALASPTPYCPTRFPDRGWWISLLHETGGLLVLDVSTVFGHRWGDKVKSVLRRLQLLLKPSRRDRLDHLEASTTHR